jgi:hypothetical protein
MSKKYNAENNYKESIINPGMEAVLLPLQRFLII